MTKAEAKRLTLEVWEYLAEHPECDRKSDLPLHIYNKIKDMVGHCPLCELHMFCNRCILHKASQSCSNYGSAYLRWYSSVAGESGNAQRAAAAWEIVRIVETMETEE